MRNDQHMMIGAHARMRRAIAFTVVELMVVMAIIVVLLSLIIVALNLAGQRAQRANTTFLMRAISAGLESFRNDHGYLPPVLDANRGLSGFTWNEARTPVPPGTNASPADVQTYINEMQEWFSYTSLAEFLLGYDEARYTGYGFGPNSNVPPHNTEIPPLGIRSPGQDGVWNAVLNPVGGEPVGSLDARNPSNQGRVYGIYVDVPDERRIAKMDPVTGNVLFPGDANFDDANWPRVFVDGWGRPLRYYRRPYPILTPGRPHETQTVEVFGVNIVIGTLADVFALRPFQQPATAQMIRVWADDSQADQATGYGQAPTSLRTAQYAIFSSGPDRAANNRLRYDDPNDTGNVDNTSFVNEDNMVEVGQ